MTAAVAASDQENAQPTSNRNRSLDSQQQQQLKQKQKPGAEEKAALPLANSLVLAEPAAMEDVSLTMQRMKELSDAKERLLNREPLSFFTARLHLLSVSSQLGNAQRAERPPQDRTKASAAHSDRSSDSAIPIGDTFKL